MEDGLDLWLAVLENSFTVTPELFSLCDNILPIIGKLMTSVINDHSEVTQEWCECIGIALMRIFRFPVGF